MTMPEQKLDPRVRSLLTGLRWRIRGYVWLEGFCLVLVWIGLTFWAGLAMDYLPILGGANEMPRWARALALLVIAMGIAYILYRWVLRRSLVRLANRSMAILLERRFPGFRDSLVTAVEMTEVPGHAEQFDASMLANTGEEALSEIGHVKLREIFSYRPLGRSLVTAVVLVLSVLLLYAMNRDALAIGVNRLYLLGDQTWPRSARIEVVGVELIAEEQREDRIEEIPRIPFRDKQVKVATGANLRLRVRADLRAKVVPDYCTVYYTTENGEWGWVTMTRMKLTEEGQFQEYAFSGKPFRDIRSSLTFDVVGADYRVRDYAVQVVDSPGIVSVDVEYLYPNYLYDDASAAISRSDPLAGSMALPRGTQVTIRATTNKPLRQVELYDAGVGKEDPIAAKTVLDLPSDDPPFGFTHVIPRLDQDVRLDVTLHDTDDVRNEEPYSLEITAITDRPPEVKVRLQGIGSAVTPDVVIPVQGEIIDEYAVDKAWWDVELVGGGTTSDERNLEPRAREVQLERGRELNASLDFREWRSMDDRLELRPKDKLFVSVKASDRYDLEGTPHVGSGDRYQLDVVTPETLLAMLESREIGLRRRFEQIVDEVTQARDSLKRVELIADAGGEPGDRPQGDEPDDAKLDEAQQAERTQNLRLLRTQQALQQTRKSAQELLGVATAFRDIRAELINNRVDTEDRKQRLQELVANPMQQIGEEQFPQLAERIAILENLLLEDVQSKRYDAGTGQSEAGLAVDKANEILAELDKILQQMLDLETFNELLDIVRQLMDDQKRLIDDTGKERKKSLLRDLQ